MQGRCPFSRRFFLAGAGGLAAAVPGFAAAGAAPAIGLAPAGAAVEPFWGEHQGGIATSQQKQTYFAAFDLVTTKAADVAKLLRDWTTAVARMAAGQTAAPLSDDLSVPAGDSGEALGLGAARLTVTFGFGAGLFTKNGADRYGLAGRRPEALVDLPLFNGDQLQEGRTGGDLSVQACADDPQVAFHAIRQLVRLADGIAQIRWVQAGFLAVPPANASGTVTPRNLLGFKDGTQNPLPQAAAGPRDPAANPASLEEVVWVPDDGPSWMRGGTYLVARRIRLALEHWERTETDFQEQVIGRHKLSGAPLSKTDEFDPLDLDATDSDGNSVIPDNAHIRLAAAASNGGAQMLRRSYSYNDGVNFTAERWPPWRQGMEYDAGLLFVCYQRDPRASFIRIFQGMSKLDALNQFATHTGGGLFACPGGVQPGGFIGQGLFESA